MTKNKLILFLLIFLVIPLVNAECGITNLAACIPETVSIFLKHV